MIPKRNHQIIPTRHFCQAEICFLGLLILVETAGYLAKLDNDEVASNTSILY